MWRRTPRRSSPTSPIPPLRPVDGRRRHAGSGPGGTYRVSMRDGVQAAGARPVEVTRAPAVVFDLGLDPRPRGRPRQHPGRSDPPRRGRRHPCRPAPPRPADRQAARPPPDGWELYLQRLAPASARRRPGCRSQHLSPGPAPLAAQAAVATWGRFARRGGTILPVSGSSWPVSSNTQLHCTAGSTPAPDERRRRAPRRGRRGRPTGTGPIAVRTTWWSRPALALSTVDSESIGSVRQAAARVRFPRCGCAGPRVAGRGPRSRSAARRQTVRGPRSGPAIPGFGVPSLPRVGHCVEHRRIGSIEHAGAL